MNINDIMINDFVLFNNEVYKVTGIYGLCNMLDLMPYRIKNKEGKYLLPVQKHMSRVYPIPLTEEILKANGCELHEFNGVMRYERSEFIIHHSMRDCVGRNNFTYKYVHQLQHALRLCGLNDFADNFKN